MTHKVIKSILILFIAMPHVKNNIFAAGSSKKQGKQDQRKQVRVNIANVADEDIVYIPDDFFDSLTEQETKTLLGSMNKVTHMHDKQINNRKFLSHCQNIFAKYLDDARSSTGSIELSHPLTIINILIRRINTTNKKEQAVLTEIQKNMEKLIKQRHPERTAAAEFINQLYPGATVEYVGSFNTLKN